MAKISPARRKAKPIGKTLVAVFTEKEKRTVPATRPEIKKRVRLIKKAMMTTKNIIKEPEDQPKSNYPGPRVEDPQPGPVAAKKGESKNERILRVLRNAAKRLKSQGMPELDVELDELIKEVEGW